MLFTDRAAFNSRLAAQTLSGDWREGFESADADNDKTGSPRLDFANDNDNDMTLTVSSTRFSVTQEDQNERRFVTEGDKAIKAVPGGWGPDHGPENWADYNNPDNNAYGALKLEFTRSINFLAMDITDLGTSDGQSILTGLLGGAAGLPGTPLDLLTAGKPHACERGNLRCNNEGLGQALFFAVSSDVPFTSIELGLREGASGDGMGFVLHDFVGFDNLHFGSGATWQVPLPTSLWLMLPGLLLLRRRS